MEDTTQIFNATSWDQVWELVLRDVISVSEYFQIRKTGKLEKDNIKIYKNRIY